MRKAFHQYYSNLYNGHIIPLEKIEEYFLKNKIYQGLQRDKDKLWMDLQWQGFTAFETKNIKPEKVFGPDGLLCFYFKKLQINTSLRHGRWGRQWGTDQDGWHLKKTTHPQSSIYLVISFYCLRQKIRWPLTLHFTQKSRLA